MMCGKCVDRCPKGAISFRVKGTTVNRPFLMRVLFLYPAFILLTAMGGGTIMDGLQRILLLLTTGQPASAIDKLVLALPIASANAGERVPQVVAPVTATPAPVPANTDWRFDMRQDGRTMTADEFDAWMRARSMHVATGKPMRAPVATRPVATAPVAATRAAAPADAGHAPPAQAAAVVVAGGPGVTAEARQVLPALGERGGEVEVGDASGRSPRHHPVDSEHDRRAVELLGQAPGDEPDDARSIALAGDDEQLGVRKLFLNLLSGSGESLLGELLAAQVSRLEHLGELRCLAEAAGQESVARHGVECHVNCNYRYN
jgi:ferredoxin